MVPGALLSLLLAGGALAAHHAPHKQAIGARGFTPQILNVDLSSKPSDFAPSAMRQRVLDRRDAGQPLPDPALVELEEQNQAQQVQLAAEAQQLQSREADIGKLTQALTSDSASLARVASTLGLPKDRLAAGPPVAQKGVGALLPADQSAITAGHTPAAAARPIISTPQQLEALVKQYIDLPCPLPAGDARCGRAVDHAKAELARGHGLDADRPDAAPVLAPAVNQPFGPTDVGLEPLEPVNGQLMHFHEGIDLAGNYDDPVLAAASGTVVFAGIIPSGALTVEIAHAGGLHTLYLHEDALLVQQGQHVQKGQVIGLVGTTGMATGPHLHFQIND
ncbi:MAG TPA: M23 family metallopeptidase, partial [Chloroflexota bacterium]